MGRKHKTLTQTNPITDPNSSNGLHSACGGKLPKRKGSSYFNMYQQTQEKISRPIVKQFSHRNKNVTYNSSCNGDHGNVLLCSKSKKQLIIRKKNGTNTMMKGSAMSKLMKNERSQEKIDIINEKGVVMHTRRKLRSNFNCNTPSPIEDDCLHDASLSKGHRRGARFYKNGTSKPKQTKSSIQIFDKPMHSTLTEQVETKSTIKIHPERIQRTDTLLLTGNEQKSQHRLSIKPHKSKFKKTNTLLPGDNRHEERKLCVKLLSQSHVKSNIFSSNDLNESIQKKPTRTVRQLCPQSHQDTWIY